MLRVVQNMTTETVLMRVQFLDTNQSSINFDKENWIGNTF